MAGLSAAQAAPTEPASAFARRVVKTFDFNERPQGNLEDLPMHWEKITSSGFPHYVNGGFDETVGCPGPSFKFQLNGGNLGYVFAKRLIPAYPGSDHKIIAQIRTRNLRWARGYLEAFYIDRYGKYLLDTVVHSVLIEPPKPSDPEWQTVSLELPYTNLDGRFIGLGVFLVQQDQLSDFYAAPVKSYRKDINATMWIDQITVLRLPKARLNLEHSSTLFDTGQEVVVGATVADPNTDDLSARIVLDDLAENRIERRDHPVAVLPPLETILRGQASSPGLINHRLGCLPPGPYRISLQVLSQSKVIIDKSIRIAVLNRDRPAASTTDFGLDLSSAQITQTKLLADFTGRLKPTWVILPIWRQDIPISHTSSDPSPADTMILEINHKGIPIVGAFLDVPEELASRTKILNPNIWDFFGGDPSWWQSELSIILSRHADRIDHWIFGRVSDGWSSPDPRIGRVLKQLRHEFGQFQGQFSLLAGWPALIDGPGEGTADGLLLTVPSELVPNAFEAFFRPWRPRAANLWMVLESLDPDQYQLQPAVVDFVQRFIQAKCSQAKLLAAKNLWAFSNPLAPGGCEPSPGYIAYANLIDRLSGLEYLSDIEISPDRYGKLFQSAERAVLVLTDPNPQPYRAAVSLGDTLRAYDMWGRTLPIKVGPAGWEVPYRPVVFIDGIESDLARFVASIKFDPAIIASKFGAHQVRLTFKNTFSQSVSGMVHLQGPPYWQFDPSGSRFALSMGKEFSLPAKLRYPSNESIGRKSIRLRIDLEARKPIQLNLIVPLRLGVSDLDMRVLWFLRGQELVVWQEVANNGAGWADLIGFTIAPDRPRMERQIRRLGPGQTATKEYSLGPWKEMLRKTIRVGFREVRGNRLANEVITLE